MTVQTTKTIIIKKKFCFLQEMSFVEIEIFNFPLCIVTLLSLCYL